MPENGLTIKIKTLTPLWTGGVDTTMDRIHETGIIGSLRWWYEAIVRGLGGSACDPTSDGKDGIPKRCPDDAGKYCDVCRVFGATGLQRSFKLMASEWWNLHRESRLTVKVNKNRGWYLGRGIFEPLCLSFYLLRMPPGISRNEMLQGLFLTLKLIEKWGSLGARTQQGYGVIKIENILKNGGAVEIKFDDALKGFEALKNSQNRRQVNHHTHWPNIEKFFFLKVQFEFEQDMQLEDLKKWLRDMGTYATPDGELKWYFNSKNYSEIRKVIPLAPLIRYHLRSLFRAKKDNGEDVFSQDDRHQLMGELGRKSLIHVSHAYLVGQNQWEFRIWGWIPNQLQGGVERKTVLSHLKQWLGIKDENRQFCWIDAENGKLWQRIKLNNPKICWMEMQDSKNVRDYLKRLVNFEETKNDGS